MSYHDSSLIWSLCSTQGIRFHRDSCRLAPTHTQTHTLFGWLFSSPKEAEENNLLHDEGFLLFRPFPLISLTFTVMLQNILGGFGPSAAPPGCSGLTRTWNNAKANPPPSHGEECSLSLHAPVRKYFYFFLPCLRSFLPPSKDACFIAPQNTLVSCWIIVTPRKLFSHS